MRRHFGLIALLLVCTVAGCKREAAAPRTATTAQVAEQPAPPPPAAPKDLPTAWPSGTPLTLSLHPDAGATTLTKALYEEGDVVVEQTYPDGTRERWWYPPEGHTHHVKRDGSEVLEDAP
ncbi:hypothetical protein [Cognatilysobacter terrigena]|uniref:hypothetical protein n=1 Tax=Cognatilysobacter terrigena TaxID=2488749 RepID=UPI0010610DDE|nr:hypothetical protein [Lysobacter terrigena]